MVWRPGAGSETLEDRYREARSGESDWMGKNGMDEEFQ